MGLGDPMESFESEGLLTSLKSPGMCNPTGVFEIHWDLPFYTHISRMRVLGGKGKLPNKHRQ